MKVHLNINKLPAFKNPVVTIGTFDGVHLGHQKIIGRIKELAHSINGEDIIITFSQHPRIVLKLEDTSLKLLNTLEEKISILEKLNVSHLIVIPFTKEFSELTADEFIHDILVANIHPKMLVIGYDHHFGKNRKGDINYLKNIAPKHKLIIEEITKQLIDDITISSTKIREALLSGDTQTAFKLSGHYFSLSGNIIKGAQRGKKIGFPTANIQIDDPYKIIPANGAYAVKIEYKKKLYDGMLNIGYRPTFNGKTHSIEAHIFDFNENIYDEHLKIYFIAQIREEIKFKDQGSLKKQLQHDKNAAVKSLSLLKEL